MAWYPISGAAVQRIKSDGKPASGYVLKFYAAGTSTVIPMATDATGATQANYALYNSNGDITVSNAVILPHLDQDYKLAVYPSLAAANANSGAVFTTADTTIPGNVTLASIGVSASIAELDKLDGAVVTTAEINHLAGVTSPIQTQIDAKAAGAASSVDNEIALFSGTGGKTLKRATQTGVLVASSGVMGTAVSGTDFKTIAGNSLLGSGNIAITSPMAIYISTTAAAQSSIDIEWTGTTYDDYIIFASSVFNAVDATFNAQWKISGVYDTGANYSYTIGASSATGTTSQQGIIQSVRDAIFFEYRIANVNAVAKKLAVAGMSGGLNSSGTPVVGEMWCGSNTNTDIVTGVRISVSSGSFSGTFKLFGVRNSL